METKLFFVKIDPVFVADIFPLYPQVYTQDRIILKIQSCVFPVNGFG
jgi:hypothetical protein